MNLKTLFLHAAIAASLVAAAPAMAGVISFDEFAADNLNGGLPAARYASMGVTFVTTDDGSSQSGLSARDPGSWGLEGTNGTNFSGYNGASYEAGMLFTSTVTGVSLDVSRSNGSNPGARFRLQGLFEGAVVDTVLISLNDPVNTWTTVSLSGVYDELQWRATTPGDGFHPYGVDNIIWTDAGTSNPAPEPASLALVGAALALMGAAARRRT